MKHLYLIAGAVLGVLYLKGAKKKKADTTINEGLNFTDASTWQGDAWSRINGALDMVLPNHPNLTQSAQADPGRIGLASTGLVASWNGGL